MGKHDVSEILETLRKAERLAKDFKTRNPLYASADTLHRRINESKRIAAEIQKLSSGVPRA